MTSIRTGLTAGLACALAPMAAAQLTIVSNLPGSFVDISGTGTPLSLADDGEADIATTIGNALFAAGTARVGSNGGVRFAGTDLELAFGNLNLPAAGAFGLTSQSLLPFWDDVNTVGGTLGEIYWQETMGMLIVQWDNIEFFNSPGLGTARFQVQVPATGTTWARFVYDDIMQVRANGGESATIGYQAGAWGNDVEFSFNTAGAVMDGTVLSLVGTFTPPPPPPAPTLTIVDNLPGTWVDISTTGTPLSLADDAEVDISTTISNALFAAGVVRVGSNGGIRFDGTGQDLGVGNQTLPNAGAFGIDGQSLLGFWDDIDTESGLWGEIYWQETMGMLIVQWQATAFFNGSATADTVTFQIQVPSNAGAVMARFLYQDVSSVRADGGGSATIGYQAGSFANQNDVQWSFDTPGAVANGDVLSLVMGAGSVGAPYCTANANSTGAAGVIAGSGSATVASNDLTLEASSLPANAFGFFLTSATQAMTPNPGGSQGILCLGGLIGRYVGAGQIKNSGAAGEFSLLLNLNQIPTPNGFVSAMVGQTRSFQAWYRDAINGVATSNFTNGLAVTFN
ncbi:MAG: hypothetical protein R3F49_17985 [Planctomycetota bacterium]